MIVGERQDEVVLVRQIDHARLAGELARQWGNGPFERPEPFDSVVLATDMHDEGWDEPDDEPLYNEDKKRPTNFIEADLRDHSRLLRARGKGGYATRPLRWLARLHALDRPHCGRWGTNFGMIRHDLDQETQDFLNGVIREQEQHWIDLKNGFWERSEARSGLEKRVWQNYESRPRARSPR